MLAGGCFRVVSGELPTSVLADLLEARFQPH